MKKIYHLATCSTCKKIIKELNTNNVELQDIKTQPITESQLEVMKNLSGDYESLFNRRAQKYRILGLNEMKLSEADFKKYILQEYTFLKRPVIVSNNKIFVGNSKLVIEEAKSSLA